MIRKNQLYPAAIHISRFAGGVSCILLLPGGDILLGCRAGEVILVTEDTREAVQTETGGSSMVTGGSSKVQTETGGS